MLRREAAAASRRDRSGARTTRRAGFEVAAAFVALVRVASAAVFLFGVVDVRTVVFFEGALRARP
jgi:hypothetical protein